jgi:hypothetical protein
VFIRIPFFWSRPHFLPGFPTPGPTGARGCPLLGFPPRQRAAQRPATKKSSRPNVTGKPWNCCLSPWNCVFTLGVTKVTSLHVKFFFVGANTRQFVGQNRQTSKPSHQKTWVGPQQAPPVQASPGISQKPVPGLFCVHKHSIFLVAAPFHPPGFPPLDPPELEAAPSWGFPPIRGLGCPPGANAQEIAFSCQCPISPSPGWPISPKSAVGCVMIYFNDAWRFSRGRCSLLDNRDKFLAGLHHQDCERLKGEPPRSRQGQMSLENPGIVAYLPGIVY